MPSSTPSRPLFPPSTPEGSGAAAVSDEQLVALLRRGQHSAFEILATRYQPRLLSYCRQMLRSKEDAEDALQDAFAAAFRAILADEREIHVRPWLYQIARNGCINRLRRARTGSTDALDDDHVEGGRTPAERVIIRQQMRELVDDLQVLPDSQRTALLLREFDGFAYRQIAAAMETTVPAVKSLLVRARAGMHDSATLRAAEFAPSSPAAMRAPRRACRSRHARTISYRSAHLAASDAA